MTGTTGTTTSHPWIRTAAETLRSARLRILGWVLLLTALGMTFAGAAVYVVERARIETRVDQSLAQEVDEFRKLAAQRNSETGQPLGPRELLSLALQRNIPDRHEAMFSFLDGSAAYFAPSEQAEAISTDEEFHRAVRAILADGRPGFDHADTQAGTVRIAVLPVRQGDQTHGWVVAHQIDRALAEFDDVIGTYTVVAATGLVLVGAVGWIVAGRLLRPARLVRQTAQQISENDLTKRIQVSGDDDLSELARTFNAMLDRLEAAFRTQRQFLDDASHELRTPITIVRGHLELLDHDNPRDIDDTKALVLDELDRMSRLVEDLITLAKAERPDFLRIAPVNLGALLDDILDKARSLGDRHWRVDASSHAIVQADAHRLTQALLQLADNAVKHTTPHDVVAFGTHVDGFAGTVRFWVRDTGPGITPANAQRIFERFQRAEASYDGSGLGLAIVSAIAEAFGGRVELNSRPGAGAIFTLVIPHVRVYEANDDRTEVLPIYGAVNR